MLEAFSKIPQDKAQLTVVGAFNRDDQDIAPYLHHVQFTGMVLHSEVPQLLQNSDVFVFPSLGDSFALSALEAAACGLPLIVSENTGMADLMVDGKEGFIIPIQSSAAIYEKAIWFIEHPESIEEMGRAARCMSEKMTWENYYQSIGESVSVSKFMRGG